MKHRWDWLILLIVVAVAAMSGGGPAGLYDDREHKPRTRAAQLALEDANGLMYLLHFKEALPAYDRVLALEPDYAPAYRYRGLALFQLDVFAAADQNASEAIRLQPGYALAYNDRAYFRACDPDVTRSRLQGALTDADQALALLAEKTILALDVHDTRGCVLLRSGQPRAALAEFNRVLLRSDDPQTLCHRAEAHYRLGNRSAAKADISRSDYERRAWQRPSVASVVPDGGEFKRFSNFCEGIVRYHCWGP